MQQKSITRILEDIAMLLEIKGDNPFKTRAYYNAAKTLSGITNLDELIKEKKLKEIKGIGEALSKKIEEYSETGKMEYLRGTDERGPRIAPRTYGDSKPGS